ncbi:MAG: 3' terminal RNA ribose 2'-O-methyltransferase Hen1 [Acidobacteria bacterium]|nr:3' terminal RNA ribose 2'-O-methyltransferase Hen1 [Acidobacteriota bacterium]
MLLTIRTTHRPATDLGFLLHKHPEHVHSREFPFGNATVFYPEATEEACTAAVLLDVDPVAMVRGRGGKGGAEDQYVNDRPYVASSLISVVLTRWFNSAIGGRCEKKPELTALALPLEARIAAVPCRSGEQFLRTLFEPLGYEVEARRHELDEKMPALGTSRLFTVTLRATRPLSELLTHLYILIPVLDDQKHYWVGDDEVEKLLRRGEGWLESHPSRDVIVSRYLVHQRGLVRDAIARLTAEEQPEEEAAAQRKDEQEATIEQTISLNERRLDAVVEVLKSSGATRVLDLGCGEGKLLRRLLADHQLAEIVGMDVSGRVLDMAESRLKLDRLAPTQRARIRLMHGSLMYRDARLSGFDAASVVEVVEHLDPPRLHAFERVLFEAARPSTIALTTPNAEYNVKWPSLPAGRFRHQDHRFEWTRVEFQGWATDVASRHGYAVTFQPVGDEDREVGPPTQMAVFTR